MTEMLANKLKGIEKLINSSAEKLQEYRCNKCKDKLFILYKNEQWQTLSKQCECYNQVMIEKLINSSAEKLQEYRCNKCKDKLFILYKNEQWQTLSKQCECYNQVINEKRLERTQLANKKYEYTFENYKANEEWQKDILNKSKAYVKCPNGWFYIGGQVGSGKTHICTAVVRNIAYLNNMSFEYILFNQKMTELKQMKFEEKDGQVGSGKTHICTAVVRNIAYLNNMSFEYILFNQKMTELKQMKFEEKEKYQEILNRLIEIDILFIDDLCKFEPTKSDLDILFDIINNRYLNNKICVISSEKFISDIYKIDSATGSRIIEKSSCVLEIEHNENKNYRLKG